MSAPMNHNASPQPGGTPACWSGAGAPRTQDLAQQAQTWDAMESYFECITTCSLDDGDCVTQCVEQLREQS